MSVLALLMSKVRNIHSLLGSLDFLGSYGHGLPTPSFGWVTYTCSLTYGLEWRFPALVPCTPGDGDSVSWGLPRALQDVWQHPGSLLTECQ